jgi:hypothetical protein
MCRYVLVCDCQPAASGSTGVGTVSLWLLRLTWRVAQLLLAGLIAALVWATPRAWRLSVRATRAGWRRWQRMHVPPATPVPTSAPLAIAPERAVTWSELTTKEAANR